jgi:MFS family permease
MGLQAIQATNGTFLATYLDGMGTNPFWISVILSLDPITCILVVPLLNRWSDRTRSRWGRRLPFIVAGSLIAALSVAGIGLATQPLYVAVGMVLLYVGTSAVWGPYRALLAELVPAQRRTTATSLQGLGQGVGGLLAMGCGSLLLTWGPGRPFLLAAGVLIACGLATVTVIGRTADLAATPVKPAMGFAPFFRQAKDLHWLLAAQTCWWAAMSGVIGFAVLYVTHEILGIGAAGATTAANQQAVGVLILFAIVSMVATVPCGRLAARYGLARVLRWGMVVLFAGLTMGIWAADLTTLRIGITLCGLGFAAIQVIPLALFVELQPPGHEGSVMSLLSVFTDGPLMIGYLLEGWLIAQTGSYRVTFVVGAVFIAAAWLCLGRIRHAGRPILVQEV